MKKIFWISCLLSLIFGSTTCTAIKRYKLLQNDEKQEQGVFISLLDDYKYKNIENAIFFSKTRVFIAELGLGEAHVYYIFWSNGRCFHSTVRKPVDMTLYGILNDKTGTAGYYYIENNTLITERYADGVFLYEYFKVSENKLLQIGFKRRKPFKNKINDLEMHPNFWFEERYTRPGADSVYFNSDSVALWQPFW